MDSRKQLNFLLKGQDTFLQTAGNAIPAMRLKIIKALFWQEAPLNEMQLTSEYTHLGFLCV